MKLFTSDGCSYNGMDEETVIRLRSELGRDTVFITEEQYRLIVEVY